MKRLYEAASWGHEYGRTDWYGRDLITVLLRGGADHHRAGRRGFTPLHLAALKGLTGALLLLLDGGAQPDKKDEDGWTPLHCAAEYGDKEAIQLLLERGADPKKRNRRGNTALYYAADGGHEEIVQLLKAKYCRDREDTLKKYLSLR